MRRAQAVALAGCGLLLAALTFDARTLFVPALALLALAGLSEAWISIAARGTRVERILEAERVVEEQPVEARIHVSAGWLGLPGAEVHDPLAGGSITLSSARTRRIELRVLARFPTRGRVILAPPALRLTDPFGLAARTRHGSASGGGELLVLPRTERVSWLASDGRASIQSSGGGVSLEPMGATELDGLRRYRPGTPASRIHWPALARGAGLLERRLLAEDQRSALVILDARCAEPGELVNAAVRAAASLTLELARRDGCDLLLAGQRRPLHVARDLGAWPALHAQLALVEGGPEVPGPLPALPRRAGATFYVAAQPGLLAPAGAAEAGAGFVLVVPKELADGVGKPAIFEVTGCVGFLMEASGRRRRPVEQAA